MGRGRLYAIAMSMLEVTCRLSMSEGAAGFVVAGPVNIICVTAFSPGMDAGAGPDPGSLTVNSGRGLIVATSKDGIGSLGCRIWAGSEAAVAATASADNRSFLMRLRLLPGCVVIVESVGTEIMA